VQHLGAATAIGEIASKLSQSASECVGSVDRIAVFFMRGKKNATEN
jgi:hypothetical protein